MCRDDACADCATSPKRLCSVHIRIPKIRLLRSRVCIRRPSITHARYFAVFRPRMRHARHPPLFRRIVSRPVHTYLYYCIRNSYTQNVLARSAYIFDPSPRQSPFLPNPAITSRCHHSSADRALSDPPDTAFTTIFRPIRPLTIPSVSTFPQHHRRAQCQARYS